MTKPALREAVAVEGKYDRQRVLEAVKATVIPIGGFSLFKDKQTSDLLRALAKRQGLIILTDSDGAGLVLRNRIAGLLPKDQLKHAVMPPVPGRERRKRRPSKAGLLGVEGFGAADILAALRAAGGTFAGEEAVNRTPYLTKQRLFNDGLSGRPDSARRRKKLLRAARLPDYLSANRMAEIVSGILSEEEYLSLLTGLSR